MRKLMILAFAILAIASCTKKEPPTPLTAPVIKTAPVTVVSSTEVLVSAEVVSDGGAAISDRGFYWGTSEIPTNKTTVDKDKPYSLSLSDLKAGTTYYVKAFATNSSGTSYGDVVEFTTLSGQPIIMEEVKAFVTTTTAGISVKVNANGAKTSVVFSYGTNANLLDKSVDASSNGSSFFTANLSGLVPGTTYYIKAVATNSLGTVSSSSHMTMKSALPILGTVVSDNKQSLLATDLFCIVNSNGFETTVKFLYGNSKDLLDKSVVNTIAAGNNEVFSVANLSGLTLGANYYFKVIATNVSGTVTDSIQRFYPYVAKDIDGNYYTATNIYGQVWLRENLKVEHYNDGSNIPNVTDNTAWSALSTGAYCYYNNDKSNKSTYGALYNFFAIDTKKLAPIGWHVASDDEWTNLRINITGHSWYDDIDMAGAILKEVGTLHWQTPNTGATDDYGFSALPGGDRNDNAGEFDDLTRLGYFWSATSAFGYDAWAKKLSSSGTYLGDNGAYNQKAGVSVRCIKD